MGRIEDLAAEMHAAELTLDDHMLNLFYGCSACRIRGGARNLACRNSIGRDDMIEAVRERQRRCSENRKKGFNAGHADHAMFTSVGGGGRRKGGGGGAHGKGGGRGKGKGGRRGQ